MARKYIVEGGSNLEGEITIRGAKNAVTKEMVASLLAPGVTRLRNVPDIGDVDITRRVMESLGCKITHDAEAGTLESDTSSLATPEVPAEYSGLNRIPILMAGPLLHRFGRAVIPMMGGCGIGERPLDFHLQGFQSLGAKAEYRDGAYHFNADKLTGTRITLPFPSVGATENLMMAATMARGTTEIRNAAIEPEIVDLALLLQAMGAIISQETDRTWMIQGVDSLRPADHRVLNDRIEAASFAASAVATRGDVFIRGADQLHLLAFLNWMRRAGGEFEVRPDGIRFYGRDRKLKSIAAETGVHPGLMTDWQQPLVILLTQAEGMSVIHETVYENRFGYVEALNRMGAKIQVFSECLGGRDCRFRQLNHQHSAVIWGPTPLQGAEIEIPDLRAGFSYLVAAVLAKGRTSISGVRYIERGYDRVVEKFRALGASIQVVEE
ncbi:MAG TPA: UDP-N-acetylglucosamine 1-carboxyvinyltransferase [Fibrobacteres bacterium]|jgi:UDP-N-acetylglucosamine 1-carboxyvinyltransferase|nr:UDP-N-acetylglucosamine 1-carboxyvinyltransferase [Fibrobacterota bacterium]